jgi:hypothetical protein
MDFIYLSGKRTFHAFDPAPRYLTNRVELESYIAARFFYLYDCLSNFIWTSFLLSIFIGFGVVSFVSMIFRALYHYCWLQFVLTIYPAFHFLFRDISRSFPRFLEDARMPPVYGLIVHI